jgi:hypothetical protein
MLISRWITSWRIKSSPHRVFLSNKALGGGLLMRDYTKKRIYVGIDVHKKSYSVTAVCDRQVVKKDRLPADPNCLIQYCNPHSAPLREVEGSDLIFSRRPKRIQFLGAFFLVMPLKSKSF